MGFPGGSVVEHLPANAGDAGDVGSIPGSGRSPGGGNGNSLQHSCLEKIPWIEELEGFQFMCCKELDTTERAHMRMCACLCTLTHEIYCKELAQDTMEAENSQDLQLASWKLGKADMQSESEGLNIQIINFFLFWILGNHKGRKCLILKQEMIVLRLSNICQ